MRPDIVFAIANNGILVFWALLVVAPRWRGTQIAVHSIAVPVILGATYLWLIGTAFLLPGTLPHGAGFGSLAAVMLFFSSPVAATAGWIHYLVFDLFIGAWQVRDAGRRNLSHFAVIPCLLLTLLIGPVGLLAYLVLRLMLGKGSILLEEESL